MNEYNKLMPAFPATEHIAGITMPDGLKYAATGLTKREYIAVEVLKVFIAEKTGGTNWKERTELALEYADALLSRSYK